MVKNKIKNALENNGFDVKECDNFWLIQQYTPAGEDWFYEVENLEDMKQIAENYNPEDDFEVLFEAKQHGLNGVPSVPELWKDQLWKQETLNKVLEEL